MIPSNRVLVRFNRIKGQMVAEYDGETMSAVTYRDLPEFRQAITLAEDLALRRFPMTESKRATASTWIDGSTLAVLF